MTIGDILTAENYTHGAIWCNANNAHIEMINGQYTIVANAVITPTKAEQVEAIDKQYEADKSQLLDYYTEAVIRADADLQADVKAELVALDSQYDIDIQNVTEG